MTPEKWFPNTFGLYFFHINVKKSLILFGRLQVRESVNQKEQRNKSRNDWTNWKIWDFFAKIIQNCRFGLFLLSLKPKIPYAPSPSNLCVLTLWCCKIYPTWGHCDLTVKSLPWWRHRNRSRSEIVLTFEQIIPIWFLSSWMLYFEKYMWWLRG